MDITWHGYSCFSIKTAKADIVINPYSQSKGLKLPKLKTDISIITGAIAENDNLLTLWGEPYIIDCAGEYEIKEIAITAMQIYEDGGFAFTLISEGIKLCFIEKAKSEIDDELIDKIGDVDILFVAVGGNGGMTATEAQKVIDKIEPRSIVPMFYAVDGVTEELESVDEFVKRVGINPKEPAEKLTISGKSSFKEDQTEVFILKHITE